MIKRLVHWSQSFSVRNKVMGLAVAITLLMGIGSVVVARSALIATARAELNQHAIAVATSVASRSLESVLTKSAFNVHQLLVSVRNGDPDVRYAFVVDEKGQVVGHTFGEGFPVDLLNLSAPAGDQPYTTTRLQSEEGLIHDVAVPLMSGQFGYVRVGLTETRLQQAAQGLLGGLIQTVVAVAGVGVLAALALSELLTRPLHPLIAMTRAVARGDLTQQAPPGPPDELGSLIASFNSMVTALAETRTELEGKEQARQELLQRLITAQEDERRRISRELHDEAGQSLTGLLAGLRSLSDQHPAIRERTETLLQVAHGTLEGLRHLSLELRPQSLDDLGLAVALRRYVADYTSQHGIDVDLETIGAGAGRLPGPLETCLYRIVQEALTNCARHAYASHISVVVHVRPEVASVVIEDDGVGFDPGQVLGQIQSDGRGLGLFGMQERVTLLGGTLQIESEPGQGTRLFVKCPVTREVTPDATDANLAG